MTHTAPLSILLVDDSEDDLFLMKEVLSSDHFRHEVVGVRSGVEALEYLHQQRRRHPSLVLLDINMPGMSGFETLEKIKGDAELNKIPVVMLTSSSSDEDIMRSYREGACSFISKPFTMNGVMELATTFSRYWSATARTP